MKIAVFQHSTWETPGRYLLRAAQDAGVALQIVKVWQDRFPEPDSMAGFVFLGGRANIHEEEQYPFLKKEKEYIQNLLCLDKPCLGICLGHQLLAGELGATVGKNFCDSIGVCQALLTKKGRQHPVFAGFERAFPVFKWHGQAILTPVPNHFEILATSKECQVEAFSVVGRPHIVGVQFDNYAAHAEDVQLLYDENRGWLDSLEGFTLTRDELLGNVADQSEQMALEFSRLFAAFCNFL